MLSPCGTGDAARLRIGGETLEAIELGLARRRRRLGAASKHGPHPGDQLARVERLAEIIVGADLEPDDAVDVLFERGEQNDRNVRALGAQIAACFEA